LDIKCLDPSIKSKTLLIPVIDESGSMSGNPTKQAIYSLQRIADLTFQNRNLITHMIGYSSDNQSHKVEPDINSLEYYHKLIQDKFGRGGGTSFTSAFKGVMDCLHIYKSNPDITSVEIIFLTDGEDSDIKDRTQLVKKLKTDFENEWKIQYRVNCIGFGEIMTMIF
jgi:uncharacterized protein with von Willebrand factor type A (vWA) domain